jgi:integrase/recombinase XerD
MRFLAFCGRELRAVTLGDVQAFSDSLEGMAVTSTSRTLSSVKSLLSFAHRLGYVAFDVGAAVRLPKAKDGLSARIMCEATVLKMIHLEGDVRNRAILRLLYGSGVRVSELCRLRWEDVQENGDGLQVTVFGKGGKTRVVRLSEGTSEELRSLRGEHGPKEPIFLSRRGGPISPVQVWRIVRDSAKRAGFVGDVSPHWLRHAHASHALDRGAPIHLVQATLGHASVATTSRYLHAKPSESSGRFLAI